MKGVHPTWLAGCITVAIAAVIVLLVAKLPLLAAAFFVVCVGYLFILSFRRKGFWKALWDALKTLFKDW